MYRRATEREQKLDLRSAPQYYNRTIPHADVTAEDQTEISSVRQPRDKPGTD